MIPSSVALKAKYFLVVDYKQLSKILRIPRRLNRLSMSFCFSFCEQTSSLKPFETQTFIPKICTNTQL